MNKFIETVCDMAKQDCVEVKISNSEYLDAHIMLLNNGKKRCPVSVSDFELEKSTDKELIAVAQARYRRAITLMQ